MGQDEAIIISPMLKLVERLSGQEVIRYIDILMASDRAWMTVSREQRKRKKGYKEPEIGIDDWVLVTDNLRELGSLDVFKSIHHDMLSELSTKCSRQLVRSECMDMSYLVSPPTYAVFRKAKIEHEQGRLTEVRVVRTPW
jgi:hypothetical protein